MQTYGPAFDEVFGLHRTPAVVIGITDDEPRQDEEKIDCQVTVVDTLVQVAGRIGFKYVEPYDRDGRNSAQSVEDAVMRFGICECGQWGLCFQCR